MRAKGGVVSVLQMEPKPSLPRVTDRVRKRQEEAGESEAGLGGWEEMTKTAVRRLDSQKINKMEKYRNRELGSRDGGKIKRNTKDER